MSYPCFSFEFHALSYCFDRRNSNIYINIIIYIVYGRGKVCNESSLVNARKKIFSIR